MNYLNPVSRWLLTLSLVVLAAGCAVATMAPGLLKIGMNLLGVAEQNYDKGYAEQIGALLTAFTDAQAAKTATPTGEGRVQQLALDVAVMRQRPGEAAPSPIEDGTVVYDGDGDDSKADRLKISFRANAACYVYVVAVDGTGWVTPVFPSAESSYTNPLSPEQVVLLPEGARWFVLDEHKGVENFYFLASYTRREDIERQLAGFASKTRPRKADYRRVSEPAVAARGTLGTGPGKATTVQSLTGSSHQIIPMKFLSEAGGLDLVVTRWLDHR